MKASHRAGRGRRWVVVGCLGLLGALAWLRGPSLAQPPSVSPPSFNTPGLPAAPSPAEPPLVDKGPPTPAHPSAPAPGPGAGPVPGAPTPAPPLPADNPQPPYCAAPGAAGAGGLVPMVPGFGPLAGEPVDPPAPQVTLRVRVPARVAPGEKLTYRLVVENHSQARAHHVLVRDRLSTGARFDHADPEPTEKAPDLLWKLGTLEPASRKEITLVVHTESKGEVENHAYVQCEHGQTVRTQVSRPGLRLRVSAPATAQLIHPIDFKMEVINDGQVEAKDVVLTSELPQHLAYVNAPDAVDKGSLITWKIGTLRPGQTWTRLLQVMTDKPGDYTVKSEVTAAGELREAAHTVIKVAEGKLDLKVSGPASARVDQSAVYQLTVTNTGKVPSPGVEIVDRLYENIVFVGASDGGQYANGEVRWRLRSLQPGQSQTVSCTVQAQKEGLFANVVRARDDVGLSALARASTRFSWLTLSMERQRDAVVVGQPATLVFHMGNFSRRPVTGVRLRVNVPDSLRILPLQNELAGQVEAGRVTFAQVPRLEPGESKVFSVKVEGVKSGKGMVRAEMSTAEMADYKDKRLAELACEEMVTVVQGQDPARVTFNER